MPTIGDALGMLLVEQLERGGATEIEERDDGLIEFLPCDFYFSPFRRWPARERQALRYVRGRVLDVGCGAGRVSLHLQERGLEVVAIDVSPGAVEVCRRRGVKDARLVDFASVGQSTDLGAFDTVVLFGNNFGVFGSVKRAQTLLRRLRRVCTERGRILAGSLDPYDTDDPVHLAYHARNRQRGRMPGQVRLRIRDRNLATPWFDWLFVSRDELRSLASYAGWELTRCIPDEGPAYIAILEPAA